MACGFSVRVVTENEMVDVVRKPTFTRRAARGCGTARENTRLHTKRLDFLLLEVVLSGRSVTASLCERKKEGRPLVGVKKDVQGGISVQ